MGKIGRNDPYPCGSGKKYKQCCLLKENISPVQKIRDEVKAAGYSEELSNVLVNLYNYMHRKNWWGACHASCSALYVALKELGMEPTLCIGEVYGQGLYFDHSWITIDDKIVDVAISMTLMGGAPASGIIVFDKDITTGHEPVLNYGVPGRGLEGDSLVVQNAGFTMFMDAFPDEKNGLWGVVEELLGKKIDLPALREKYAGTKRTLIRKDSEEF